MLKELEDNWKDFSYDREIGFSVNIIKVKEWLKNKKKKKKVKTELIWRYDGCDCVPEDGYRSVPYCSKHYNPLVRLPHEIKTS